MPPSPSKSGPSASDSQILAPLKFLDLARKGAAIYYPPLLDSDDEDIRIGAYCQLLTLQALHKDRFDSVLSLCHHAAIKQRAFDFFEGALFPQMASKVVSIATENADQIRTALMRAQLAFDNAAACDANAALFRVTGDIRELVRAAVCADHGGGWRAAAAWYVRAVAISPIDPHPVLELFRLLAEANQFELVEHLNRLLTRAGLHPFIVGVYGANILLARGDAKGCVAKLQSLRPPSDAAPRATRMAQAQALKLLGEAHDKLGNYEASYRAYLEMNRVELAPAVDPGSLPAMLQRDRQFLKTTLAPAQRADVAMLIGFPRSGTTLLEMVLDSHPNIEALEEPTTWDTAMAQWRISRGAAPGSDEGRFAVDLLAAREAYYAEVGSRRRKPSARLVIDKYPLRTLYASHMSRIIPDQKYIFSIRHPFDVVLSCFRQRFTPNPGMENFRTIGDTIRFYDLTLSEWFNLHDLADPLVRYVRYDSLVTEFESTVAGTLEFLGVDWSQQVHDFAESAENRIAKTPSYQKIRKGLSVGVQTSWRNYRFLFEAPEAKPLHKWAAFFGYET